MHRSFRCILRSLLGNDRTLLTGNLAGLITDIPFESGLLRKRLLESIPIRQIVDLIQQIALVDELIVFDS